MSGVNFQLGIGAHANLGAKNTKGYFSSKIALGKEFSKYIGAEAGTMYSISSGGAKKVHLLPSLKLSTPFTGKFGTYHLPTMMLKLEIGTGPAMQVMGDNEYGWTASARLLLLGPATKNDKSGPLIGAYIEIFNIINFDGNFSQAYQIGTSYTF